MENTLVNLCTVHCYSSLFCDDLFRLPSLYNCTFCCLPTGLLCWCLSSWWFPEKDLPGIHAVSLWHSWIRRMPQRWQWAGARLYSFRNQQLLLLCSLELQGTRGRARRGGCVGDGRPRQPSWGSLPPSATREWLMAGPAEGPAEPSLGCRIWEQRTWLSVLATEFWGGLLHSSGWQSSW